MNKLTSPQKKEEILVAIKTLFDYCRVADLNDTYSFGRYTAMLSLLKMVKIYEEEN